MICVSISSPVEEYVSTLLECYGHSTTGDEFDNDSIFVFAFAENEVVGMIRLTTGLYGPLQNWAVEKSPLPSGDDVVQMTRAVVRPRFRRRGVFTSMMLSAIEYSTAKEIRLASVAIEPHSSIRNVLEDIGFVALKETTLYAYAPGRASYLVNLVCELGSCGPLVRGMRWRLASRAGMTVDQCALQSIPSVICARQFTGVIGPVTVRGMLYLVNPLRHSFIDGTLSLEDLCETRIRVYADGAPICVQMLDITICLKFDEVAKEFAGIAQSANERVLSVSLRKQGCGVISSWGKRPGYGAPRCGRC
jgi:GNAT superfamily N-acetyltransferase